MSEYYAIMATSQQKGNIMKGPGRYSRQNGKSSLENRQARFESIGKGKQPKGYATGGFHKPGSNKK